MVQVHDLPLEEASRRCAAVAGKVIEHIKPNSYTVSSVPRRKFHRFKIELDLRKPIEPGCFLGKMDSNPPKAKFRYEKLSNVCLNYGFFDHETSHCSNPSRKALINYDKSIRADYLTDNEFKPSGEQVSSSGNEERNKTDLTEEDVEAEPPRIRKEERMSIQFPNIWEKREFDVRKVSKNEGFESAQSPRRNTTVSEALTLNRNKGILIYTGTNQVETFNGLGCSLGPYLNSCKDSNKTRYGPGPERLGGVRGMRVTSAEMKRKRKKGDLIESTKNRAGRSD